MVIGFLHYRNFVGIDYDGSVTFQTHASLDGEAWGVISWEIRYLPWYSAPFFKPAANVGGSWEAAITDSSEYCPTVAQYWYDDWETAIIGNLVNYEENDGYYALLPEGEDWRKFWGDHFDQVPDGGYRPSCRLEVV